MSKDMILDMILVLKLVLSRRLHVEINQRSDIGRLRYSNEQNKIHSAVCKNTKLFLLM